MKRTPPPRDERDRSASRGRDGRLGKRDLERFSALAGVGAERAAAAFAQLAGGEIRCAPPEIVHVSAPRDLVHAGDGADRGADRATAREGHPDWCTGVFFEFEGCLEAIVGILFPGHASEALVRRVLGIDTGEVEPPLIESALMEVGNILASHVASAIADRLEQRLLPSIPSLAMSRADAALFEWIEARGASDGPCVVCPLHDAFGEVEGRLVLVPTGGLGDPVG